MVERSCFLMSNLVGLKELRCQAGLVTWEEGNTGLAIKDIRITVNKFHEFVEDVLSQKRH